MTSCVQLDLFPHLLLRNRLNHKPGIDDCSLVCLEELGKVISVNFETRTVGHQMRSESPHLGKTHRKQLTEIIHKNTRVLSIQF